MVYKNIVIYFDSFVGRVREKNESTVAETSEMNFTIKSESEALLDAFLASEIPAIYENEERPNILFNQLPNDKWDYCSYYYVGERVDLDNDGENEQIVNGPYGGIYFDARDGKVYVLAEGDGTAQSLSYTYYDNATWIVHSDTTHGGRLVYWLTKYDGKGDIVDEFVLSAQYWDSPTGRYDESSTFHYRDEEISMEEYERLIKEIFEMSGYIEEEFGNSYVGRE